ncbi:MAG: radical SAM protein [Candidatus Delongbacteria bacterium]|nr:radical SAM protein [Candidatus Delongbacteria bacterium]MBN2836995.1 radical SAM protein [Candidatus Delongbacteria bacterium]
MKYLFGPVPSRRLGRSLGIDLLIEKICNFNCVYCEVAPTKVFGTERKEFIPAEEVISELKDYLIKNISSPPDFITFSGSGEPTLHSKLGYIIDEIQKMTDIPVAVITNSGTITDPSVYNDLLKADLVIPSLDAVSRKVLYKINKIPPELDIEKMIDTLKKFTEEFSGEVWLEILVCKNINDQEEEFLNLKKAVDYINPKIVQVHTISRPPMAGKPGKADESSLKRLAEIIGEKATIVRSFNDLNRKSSGCSSDIELLKSLLRVRSCHLEEIVDATGISADTVLKLVNNLELEGVIKREIFDNNEYFKILKVKR